MTLVSSIITDAYRECNMIPLGKEPNESQVTEALRLLNAIFAATYGGDAGERLTDWPLGSYGAPADDALTGLSPSRLAHPPLNSRLIAVNPADMAIALVLQPQDGARFGVVDPYGRLASAPLTITSPGRTIEGVDSITLDTDGTFREWLYRADLAGWMRLTDLEATDEMPFPARFDTLFAILLAMRLTPRYGRSIASETVALLKQAKREFVARYVQSACLETDDSISWPFLSRQSYSTGRSFSSTPAFNQGRPF